MCRKLEDINTDSVTEFNHQFLLLSSSLYQSSVYGGWPASGEIDLLEQRSNRQLYSGNTNVGVEQAGSTMHFGPR